jgi:membrane protease YdiL (CAAX protease family)
MSVNHPLLLALMTAAGAYVGRLWWADLLEARRHGVGTAPPARAFPGATDAPWRTVVIAVAGAVGLVAVGTWLELQLGLATEQSKMTGLLAVYSVLATPIIEELIFRGWMVVESRGRGVMWAGAIGASAGFAALHPFLWKWDDAGFAFTPTAKGWFSTGAIFAGSVGFYAVRLGGWNPQRSLLPCFAAHAAKNLGVVMVKAATGFVSGWW